MGMGHQTIGFCPHLTQGQGGKPFGFRDKLVLNIGDLVLVGPVAGRQTRGINIGNLRKPEINFHPFERAEGAVIITVRINHPRANAELSLLHHPRRRRLHQPRPAPVRRRNKRLIARPHYPGMCRAHQKQEKEQKNGNLGT